MKTVWTMLTVLALVLFVSATALADGSTWGKLKRTYGPDVSQKIDRGGTATPQGYSVRIKPYLVDEHWRDPNNPGSGEHVVMYFYLPGRYQHNFTRLWQGYWRDWLDRWMIRRNVGSGYEEIRLFADGWFWWGHRAMRPWLSAWSISQDYELVW